MAWFRGPFLQPAVGVVPWISPGHAPPASPPSGPSRCSGSLQASIDCGHSPPTRAPGGASCAPSSTQTAEHPPPPSAAPWQRSSPTHPTWSPGFPQPSNAAASGASTRPRFSPCRSPPQPTDRAAACLPVHRARSRPGWVHANAGADHHFGPGPPPPGCVFCWSTTSPQPGPASRPRRVSCEQRGSPWSAPLWWRRHHPEPPVTGSVPRRVR